MIVVGDFEKEGEIGVGDGGFCDVGDGPESLK